MTTEAGVFVAADGGAIHHDREGVGPTLVWGHGLTSSRDGEDDLGIVDWTHLRERLDVVRYDARGHGSSDLAPDAGGYGWDRLATDQLALADHLGIDRYVAGGASMGAATAIHAACAAAHRVRALVLMIPPTAWQTRAEQASIYDTMATIIERRGVEPLIAAAAETPSPDPFAGTSRWKERSARAMRSADPHRLATVLRGASSADFPPRDAVSAISVPTLILAWTGDAGHPVSTADELHHLIADTALHVASTPADLAEWPDLIADFVAAS